MAEDGLSTTLGALLEDIHEIYETRIVHRAMVVGADDDVCAHIAACLEAHDHSVARVTMAQMEDERPLYMQLVQDFARGDARVLVLPYEAWYALKDPHLFIEHNLLVMVGIDEENARIVAEYSHDTQCAHDPHCDTNFHVLYEPLHAEEPEESDDTL